MEIKHYEVLINEENARCGLIVDLDEYDIRFLKDHVLYYEVKYDLNKINIINENNQLLLSFFNTDKELMYYAVKSVEIPIMGGITKPEAEIKLFFPATLK